MRESQGTDSMVFGVLEASLKYCVLRLAEVCRRRCRTPLGKKIHQVKRMRTQFSSYALQCHHRSDRDGPGSIANGLVTVWPQYIQGSIPNLLDIDENIPDCNVIQGLLVEWIQIPKKAQNIVERFGGVE